MLPFDGNNLVIFMLVYFVRPLPFILLAYLLFKIVCNYCSEDLYLVCWDRLSQAVEVMG